MKFKYKTKRGFNVELTIINRKEIIAKVDGKEFTSKGKLTLDYSQSPPAPAIKLNYDFESKKRMKLNITEEIRDYLHNIG